MTVSRQTAIIAANAVPRRGGQGMNLSQMVEGWDQTFDLSVYAASGQCLNSLRVARTKGAKTVVDAFNT